MTSIYVHIPYCRSKCPYCDFASIPVNGTVDAYLRALCKEASVTSAAIDSAETLYVGGGTPTILSSEEIDTLFTHLREFFRISPQAEVTIEANPCSITSEKAAFLAAGGVNRASLGAQSFVDEELSFLGRPHKAEDIGQGISLLREAGIRNLSLDLIYAIPTQSEESWRYSLDRALELRPDHISAYCLTFEPATPFWHALNEGSMQKKTDEEELALYEIARNMLTDAGYEHYEISNFALPGKRSLHNMVYWSNEEYLGLGASAVSYLDGKRITNLCGPEAYIRAMETCGDATDEAEEIPPRMQAIETMIQRLRVREGIDCPSFKDRFGLDPEEIFGDSLPELVELDLLERSDFAIKSTAGGWRLANEVALKILD
jgi:oxygen-independent coproporphyrinogen-3 oxidase